MGRGGFSLRLRRPTPQISQIKAFWSRLGLLVPTPPQKRARRRGSLLRAAPKDEERASGSRLYLRERERIREGLMDFFFKGGRKKKSRNEKEGDRGGLLW